MLSEIGQSVFKAKFAVNDNETWQDACLRVANYIASAEEDEDKRIEYIAKFFQAIFELVFIPGGRIIANAGTPNKNLANCFVLPVEDSREGIYSTLNKAAEIFNRGGGCGYNFSKIRPKGSSISSVTGKASGPVAFMRLFDQTGELIQQSSRRGAQMGILNVDHPDIEEFITRKTKLNVEHENIIKTLANSLDVSLADMEVYELGFASKDASKFDFIRAVEKTLLDSQLTYFNASVGMTDEYMGQEETPILDLMARSAWESGDPGIFFLDEINKDNMLIETHGRMEASNPCSEIPLLPYESCILGSINLVRFYDKEIKRIDFEFLEYVTRLAVRFLDNAHTLSESGVEEIDIFSKATRRLGLGVMGWADLLAIMEIPYDSEEAYLLAEYLGWFISFFAWSESMRLADERGSFELLDLERANQHVIRKVINSKFNKSGKELTENIPVRNVGVTAIAPTGSIALLAGVNFSIEPFYAMSYEMHRTNGIKNNIEETYHEVNEILFEKLNDLEILDTDLALVREKIIETGSVQTNSIVPDSLREVFKTAHEIDWKAHVDMQAGWQKYVSNAVSKTINLPNNATVEDVRNAFEYMWKCHLKGGTVYRSGSKSFQVLN